MSVFHTVLNDHAKAKCCYPVTGSCTCGLHQLAQQDHAETCEARYPVHGACTCRRAEQRGIQNVLRSLPRSAEQRKQTPITTGCLDYFPLALAEVARCSKAGNDQHNPGQPLHWARSKSNDQADCIVRHLIERGTIDTDGIRHSAKVAWRALAMLQAELEEAAGWKPAEGR